MSPAAFLPRLKPQMPPKDVTWRPNPSCAGRAWGRRGARPPGSLPRSPRSRRAGGTGRDGTHTGAPRAVAEAAAAFPLLLAPSRGPPQKHNFGGPAAGTPPPFSPGRRGGGGRLGNHAAVWAAVPSQVPRSACKVKYSNLSFPGCVRLHSYARAPSDGEVLV